MRLLVTGASGFVGQSLVKSLELKSMSVVSVGRQSAPIDAFNMHKFIVVPDFSVEGIWKDHLVGCDVVIHLAARVHVIHDDNESPLQAFLAVNLHGTVNLALASAKAGVKRFVYVSSIKVNGEFTENEKFTEENEPNPQDPYAISKWQAEQALRKIEKETGMEVVILRPPLIYGPRVKANFASLLKLVDKVLPLPLLSINNRRSLIFVNNFTDAIITCITHPNAAGKTYLVSDSEDVSMAQLVRKIAFSLNRPSYLFYFPLTVMRLFAKLIGKKSSINRLTESLLVDSSKIRKELNWKPPFTMQQGLKITADWYRENLERNRV